MIVLVGMLGDTTSTQHSSTVSRMSYIHLSPSDQGKEERGTTGIHRLARGSRPEPEVALGLSSALDDGLMDGAVELREVGEHAAAREISGDVHMEIVGTVLSGILPTVSYSYIIYTIYIYQRFA